MKILGDDDMGKGGIDVLNTETGESTTVRERETDGPFTICLLYTSPSPRDQRGSRMPASA